MAGKEVKPAESASTDDGEIMGDQNGDDDGDAFANFHLLKGLGLLYTDPDHSPLFMRIFIGACGHYQVEMLVNEGHIDIVFIRNFNRKYPGMLSAENPSQSNMLGLEKTVARVTPRTCVPAKKFDVSPASRVTSRYPPNTETPAFHVVDIPYQVLKVDVVSAVSIF
jgi:hypothetical protein